MIEKIDARLARLAARHAELSQAIQNASVELAQVEGAHAHLTDLKREVEAAAELAPEAEITEAPRALYGAEAAVEKVVNGAKRFVTRAEAAAEMVEPVFPSESALRRALDQNAEATQ